jgi:replicative DNA helicase
MASVLEHTTPPIITEAQAITREAPHNMEAEQALLGAILMNNDALNHVGAQLVAQDFYAEIHQRIYTAILLFNDKGQLANPVTLKHHFAGGEALEDQYLARLAGAATSIINVRDYAKLINDLALKRHLISVGEEVVNRAYETPSEHVGIEQLELAEQKLFHLAAEGGTEGGFLPLKSSVVAAMERAEIAFKRTDQVVGIDTGFIDLNRLLGGLHDSDLLILAGRPSMGKTALATSIAYNAAKALQQQHEESGDKTTKAKSVGFFSLEMSGEQLAMRLLASASNIAAHKLSRGDVNEDEFGKLVQQSQLLHQLPFHIDDTPALSIAALRSRARRLKRVHNLGLLVVDYLQLVRATTTGGNVNRVQEISEITQGLKAIAKELNIPVIALSQLSRAVEQREDKRPQLSDLRESGSIEQDSDIVMFVFREEYYIGRSEPRPDTEEHNNWMAQMEEIHGLADVIIAKHRNGPIGSVKLQFQSDLTRFDNYVNEDHLPESFG